MRPVNIADAHFQGLIEKEWLDVNGAGGYACSTLCGLNTRKYHGLLVAAMAAPVRRMVLLSHLEETVFTSHGEWPLSSNEYPGTIFPQGYRHLRAFSVEPFPRWAYQGDGFTIEKSLRMLPGENTVCLEYSLLAGEKSVTLEVKPLLAMRGIHELMYQWNSRLTAESKSSEMVHIPASSRTPEMFFAHDGEFRPEPNWYLNTIYRREDERGYSGLEDLWKPGAFRWTLSPGQTIHLACSVEPVEICRVCGDLDKAREDFDRRSAIPDPQRDLNLDALIRAAGAFVVRTSKSQDARPVQVIAQYPWSAPSGRAALIGFTGLFLVCERFEEGKSLLSSLAAEMRNGLVPTDYAEAGDGPLYTGADTSLWFINAIGEYFRYTNDQETIRSLFPAIHAIIDAYRHGTDLGISTDGDGLVASRAPGLATSWMDAKFGDWVVTPRQGRTVELNALWFNGLRFASSFAALLDNQTMEREWNALAENVQTAFNRRFWNPDLQCCFDVVEDHGMDPSVRPNQILAIGLPHPILSKDRQAPVIQKILAELLTPFGVRSLTPHDPAYQGHYRGNIASRDRAQHQGSVYPCLLAPLARAYLRTFGRNESSIAKIRRWVGPCLDYLQEDGLGQLCELFDGDAPHRPGGALASAISVAEILRCYVEEIMGIPAGAAKAHRTSAPPTSSPLTATPP